MKRLLQLIAGIAIAVIAFAAPAHAGDKDPLFVNLTTDDPHRANMGITFGGNQHGRGHPLTIFLNDRAVLIGAKSGVNRFGPHQKALADLMGKGATVLICAMCMRHYGVEVADLLPEIRVANPELTGEAIFREGTKALTW
jgi:hypothetical protein